MMKSFRKIAKNLMLGWVALAMLFVSSQSLFSQHAYLELGKIESAWYSAMWSKEAVKDAPGYVRIKNRWKSTDLHNEFGMLLVGQTTSDWWSAMWELEPVSGSPGFFRIKNRNGGTYLHNEAGKIDLGKIQPNWWSAMWQWEPVSGETQYFRIKNRNTGTYLHNQNQKAYTPTAKSSSSGSAGSGGSITVAQDYKPAIKGDKVGCGNGTFYDPIDGGTCWTCPDGYKRTVFSVKSDKACELAAYERFAAAKSHGRARGILGTDCDGGQFWDPNGNCYSCPTGYTRTAHPVTSDKACSQRVPADYQPAMRMDDAKKCEGNSFLDVGTGKCWTCPDGYKRTVFSVKSEKACEKIKVSSQ